MNINILQRLLKSQVKYNKHSIVECQRY